MNILITGATGFVGRHLVRRLTKYFHNIYTTNSNNYIDTLYKIKDIKLDAIVHLAVKTHAGGYCQMHPGEQYLINTDINNEILKFWFNYQKQAKFITMGSSCGYADNIDKIEYNYLKGEPETGYEVYGNIKRNLLVGLKSLNYEFGMNYSYLIPSTFYGGFFDLNDKHFIFDLIRKIINAKKYNDIPVLWGDGTQNREIIYIDDGIDIIIKSMHWEHQIVNLSNGIENSLSEYAKILCDIIGYDYNLIKWDTTAFVGAHSKKLVNYYLNDYKFTPLRDGLIKTVEYYENCISSSK